MLQQATGNTTLFAFDSRGREVQRTLPDGAFETKLYLADGKLSQRIDFMGQAVTYAHDAAGRVLSRMYPDASIVSFTYFADGRRQTVTDESGVTSYAYDLRGRPSSITYPDGRKVQIGYDAAGRRASLTAVVGGQSHTTNYAYDAGRLAEVHDPLGRVTSLDYDLAGMRTALSYPNGVATNYAHDARGRLTSIEAKHLTTDAVVQSLVYTLDAAGRRTQIAEPAGLVRAYGYDDVDRLTTESVSGGAEPAYSKTFVYDDAGNRMTQATTGAGAGTVAYSYDVRDRLLTEAGQTYGWDANGNLTSKQGGATYTWDFENRLIGVTQPDGTVVEHLYDAEGNRIETSVTPPGGSAVATKYLVDTAGGLSHVVADTTGAGALTALYVRAGDELLAVMRPAGGGTWATRFVHHDGIGSVRVMTDEAGLVTDARSYEAFGKRTVDTGSDPLAYGFAGEAFDAVTGLAYHRARWMDPGVGRFVRIDPERGDSRRPVTLHPYYYGGNDPLRRVDPSGASLDFSLAGLSAAIAVTGVLGVAISSHAVISSPWLSIVVLPNFPGPPNNLALPLAEVIRGPFNHTLKVSDADDAVKKILQLTGGGSRIGDLTFAGHSGEDTFHVRDTYFSPYLENPSMLSPLKGHFASGGYVYITQCDVAKKFSPEGAGGSKEWNANNILTDLSTVLEVPVYAWTGAGSPGLAWYEPGGLEQAEGCKIVKCMPWGCSEP